MKNKMWQRLTSLLLVVCMVFGMSINAWAKPKEKYDITIDATLTDKVYIHGPKPVKDAEAAKEDERVVLGVKEGHDIEGLIVMCEDGTVIYPKLEDKGPDKGKYIFTMPASKVTVTVEKDVQEPVSYTITVAPSENGSVSADKDEAEEGDTVTLTVEPKTGYKLETLTVTGDGTVVAVANDYTFTMPASNVTVTASFKKVNYTITVDSSENGSVTAGKTEATAGETVTLNVSPDAGCELETLTVTDASGKDVKVTDNSFTMPASNVTVTASFKKVNYTITVKNLPSDETGTVTAPANAKAGDTVTLNVKPADGYELNKLTLYVGENDALGTKLEGTTFTMPSDNVMVTASFKAKEQEPTVPVYDIAVNPSENGSVVAVEGNGVQLSTTWPLVYTAAEYTEVTLSVSPADGYELETLTVVDANGTEVEVEVTDNSFTMPASKVTVTASFKKASTGLGDVTPDRARYIVNYYKQNDAGKYEFAERFISEPMELNAAVEAEDKAYEGYKLNAEKSVMTGNVIAEKDDKPAVLVLDVYYDALTNVTITVEWDDDNNRDGLRVDGKDVLVELLTNGNKDSGKKVKLSASEESDSATFSMLKFNNGNEIAYSVNDVNGKSIHNLPDGYTVEVSNEGNEWTVVLKHEPARMDMDVTVVWDDEDNRDGFRPSDMKLELVKNKDKQGDKKIPITTEDNKTYTYENLYVYENGEKINYSVVGAFRPASYSETVTGNMEDGYTVTLKHEPERMDMDVTVVWDDDNNRDGIRPSNMKLELVKNKDKQGDKKIPITTEDNKTYTYENLYVYENGKEINYTVVGAFRPASYSETVTGNMEDGYTVTLKHEPVQTGDVIVTVKWNDDSNRDGIRPASIRNDVSLLGKAVPAENVLVKLFRSIIGDEPVGEALAINEDGDIWTYTFPSSYKYSDVGQLVDLVAKLNKVPDGYSMSVNGTNIMLTHMPELIDISGTITWKDGSDYDNIRPDSVVIKLIGDDKEYEETFNSMAGNVWEYEFAGVHKYLNGKEIEYSVSQNKVPGYTTTIKNFDITNIHSPNYPEIEDEPEEKVVVKVKWFNDDSSYRPEEVTVQLYKDGRKYRAAAELSADKDIYENWRHVWKDVNEDKDTEWSIKVNGIPTEYIYEIEQVRSNYFVVNCTLNENSVKKNPETGAF